MFSTTVPARHHDNQTQPTEEKRRVKRVSRMRLFTTTEDPYAYLEIRISLNGCTHELDIGGEEQGMCLRGSARRERWTQLPSNTELSTQLNQTLLPSSSGLCIVAQILRNG
jgi:hypothetical protein